MKAILVTNMACRLFDPYPKSSRDEFFDLDEVINEVKKLVEGKFWPLLIGPKRTGKTSILKIVAKELNGIYIDASGIRSIRNLGNSLADKAEVKLQVDLKFIKVEISKKPTSGIQALLDKLGGSIILIDEVQNLISPWFLKLLANAYNNSQVRFAFTGSMIGLARSLMGQGKGGELGRSFKGRPIIRIEVSPFDEEKGKEFLLTGFRNCGIEVKDEEVEDAVRAFRGIQGWLTYYGNFRALGYTHGRAKEMVINVAEALVREEVKELGELERVVLRAISMVNEARWREVKAITEGLLGREVKDWSFTHALKQLVNARLVRKINDHYSLIDPLYRLAFEN